MVWWAGWRSGKMVANQIPMAGTPERGCLGLLFSLAPASIRNEAKFNKNNAIYSSFFSLLSIYAARAKCIGLHKRYGWPESVCSGFLFDKWHLKTQSRTQLMSSMNVKSRHQIPRLLLCSNKINFATLFVRSYKTLLVFASEWIPLTARCGNWHGWFFSFPLCYGAHVKAVHDAKELCFGISSADTHSSSNETFEIQQKKLCTTLNAACWQVKLVLLKMK